MTLDEIARDFKLGYKIADDLFHDILHPANPRYPIKLHDQRIDYSMNNNPWEGLGYLTRGVQFILKHPVRAYKIFTLKE